MKIFGVVEIKLITKRRQIKEALETKGKLHAVKKCKELTGWGLSKSLAYVRKLESEVEVDG